MEEKKRKRGCSFRHGVAALAEALVRTQRRFDRVDVRCVRPPRTELERQVQAYG